MISRLLCWVGLAILSLQAKQKRSSRAASMINGWKAHTKRRFRNVTESKTSTKCRKIRIGCEISLSGSKLSMQRKAIPIKLRSRLTNSASEFSAGWIPALKANTKPNNHCWLKILKLKICKSCSLILRDCNSPLKYSNIINRPNLRLNLWTKGANWSALDH